MNPDVKYNQGALRKQLIEERDGVDWIAHQTGRLSSGQRDACHVIPKRVLKIFEHGAYFDPREGFWQPLRRLEVVDDRFETKSYDEILMDTDNVVLGSRDLHDEWDEEHDRMIRRSALPASVEKFAAAHGLTWWLAEYYERRAA